MTNRTWRGGGSNRVTNGHDWSPYGAPRPGDQLSMDGGTMNVRGNDLADASVALSVTGTATLNLSSATIGHDVSVYGSPPPVFPGQQGILTVHASGTDRFALTLNGELGATGGTIDLAANARWIGGFSAVDPNFTVNGSSGAVFINQGHYVGQIANLQASLVRGGTATINADVSGDGVFELQRSKDPFAKLVFGGAVSVGQTIVTAPSVDAQVVIDKPAAFQGGVSLNSDAAIDLIGLANADSYALKNDMLSIMGCGQVLDTIRVGHATQFPISVEQTVSGVSVYTMGDTRHTAGTMLPGTVSS